MKGFDQRSIIISVLIIVMCASTALAYYAGVPAYIKRSTYQELRRDATPATAEFLYGERAFPVVSIGKHAASGSVRFFQATENGKPATYLRYDNFHTVNGPALAVYLSKDLSTYDAINLGELVALRGSINYRIPDNIRLSDYSYVLLWSKFWGEPYNSADFRLNGTL